MLLSHLRLPGIIPFSRAADIQHKLVTAFLAHKVSPKTVATPEPTLITAHFEPVYTCGRREVGSVSKKQIEFLTSKTQWGKAAFIEALRGGQTTFHGPGQLVAYPILDLKRHSITPRDYVCLLEKSVKATCATYGVKTMSTEHPGVWADEMHKICALGVHLRRHITSHGIGLNVNTELGWFDRIVACGLEGKKTTSLREQGVPLDIGVDDTAERFAQLFAERLEGVDGVRRIEEKELD